MSFKNIPLFAIIISCLITLPGCYLLKQGSYILRFNSRSQRIDKLLENPGTLPDTREFLRNVEEIRTYAVDSIGLAKNKNYTRFVKINKDYLVDVVSAADMVSFEQYKWCWPLFGCFPYKGFFEKDDAKKEAKKLQSKGYDVNIDEVDAFSTLGFFTDPLYSFMQGYSLYGIASLIIHEQTHATIYLKNQTQFNEELATFVGNQGALSYIKGKFGEDSDIYQSAILANKDRDTWYQLLRELYNNLKVVYDSNSSREDKLQKKEDIIRDFKTRIIRDYDQIFKTKRFRGIEKAPINNAYLAVRMTYTRDLHIYQDLYAAKDENLKAMMGFLKSFKKRKGDPKEMIKKEIGN